MASLDRRVSALEAQRQRHSRFSVMTDAELDAEIAPYFGGRILSHEEVKSAIKEIEVKLRANGSGGHDHGNT